MPLKTGQQIAYIPIHAEGSLEHPDVEYGFITEHQEGNNHAFARFFKTEMRVDNEGLPLFHTFKHNELKPSANSEATPIDRIVRFEHREQTWINQWLLDNGYIEDIKEAKEIGKTEQEILRSGGPK